MARVRQHRVQIEFLYTDEGRIFVLGCAMLILWVLVIALLWEFKQACWIDLLTMSFTELFLGRAAAIAHAKLVNMHPVLMVFVATYVDAVTVLISYPLLVFSYTHLFEGRFFQKHMRPIFESAQKGMDRVSGSKIAGVFAFVWFPFWMTGVVVGAALGYLLGLKHWVTMVTVTVSTMSASLCWVLFYDKLFDLLGKVHRGVPVVLTVAIITWLAVRRIIRKRREAAAGNGQAATDAGGVS